MVHPIRETAQGGNWLLSAAGGPAVTILKANQVRSRYETLTTREREVMELVVSGLLNKQIAAKLGTVEHTVKIHRSHVMEKMMADSLPALIRMADTLKSS